MKRLMVGLFFSISLFVAKAQDEGSFTDEELASYATVMVWAEQEKDKMEDSVSVWVKSNEKLSASVYNELSKANKKGNIDEVAASEEEKATFEEIQQKIEGQKEIFKEEYVGKIKEDIGAGLYNSLKKALRSDEELKGRYTSIFDSLLTEGIGGNENETVDSE